MMRDLHIKTGLLLAVIMIVIAVQETKKERVESTVWLQEIEAHIKSSSH